MNQVTSKARLVPFNAFLSTLHSIYFSGRPSHTGWCTSSKKITAEKAYRHPSPDEVNTHNFQAGTDLGEAARVDPSETKCVWRWLTSGYVFRSELLFSLLTFAHFELLEYRLIVRTICSFGW